MKYYITLMSILFLSSCTNISYNQLSGDVKVNVKADLDATVSVGEKITGNGSETVLFWFIRLPGTRYRASGNTTSMTFSNPATPSVPFVSSFNFLNSFNVIENAKGEAIHDAITSSKADIIINPKFLITENDFFFYKTVKCEVTGLKGTVTKVK